MKKALAFFGAFNPPTTAHIELARYAMEQTGRETVVFVPSRSAYIREEQGKDYAYSDRARLAMLRAAREKRPWMAVTDYELTLDHQPRSYETLCRLKEEGYDAALLMGSDKLTELETGWKYVREIAEEFGIVCMERAGDDCGKIIRSSAFLTELMPYITVLKTPEETKNISSTQVRELITRGETPEGLVPGEILDLLGTERKEHAMKLEPIITSLLDTDLYKFNMDQVIFHKHTDLSGEYYFRCRNEGVVFTPEMFEEINAQIDHLCSLTCTKDELDYLRSIRFLKSDYVEFLRLWRPIRDYVETRLTKDGTLKITVRGPLFSAMQFEIYLLEIVNEVYFRLKYDYAELRKSAEERLDEKIKAFQNGKYTFSFAEFGCRRRLSREWEDEVVRRLATETKNCVGTSNVMLAKKYGLKPIGTYAHEFVQMYQGIDSIPLAYTNHYALEDWYNEYKGDNGTALTDTVTTDLF
ncbi:MAG: nicotinate (nicotinamide) nucleotide adenylyltransferase, partial [Clostridia bacterium]|nr:nicotinate (nicotinamide) nucleotide adenylyltransferase [Clostridia bacterium]